MDDDVGIRGPRKKSNFNYKIQKTTLGAPGSRAATRKETTNTPRGLACAAAAVHVGTRHKIRTSAPLAPKRSDGASFRTGDFDA